jgi:MHS family proline/betaine transporter-like MFS transporter
LIQGFSTGGEYGGAMTFIAEYAPDKRRGFLGSWLEFGTLTGYALGATISMVLGMTLSDPQMHSWGWRIPFLIAGPLGVVGLYLRMKLEETPSFKQIAQESEGREGNQTLKDLRSVFVKHWRPMILCGGLVVGFNVTNYMLTEYMQSYMSSALPQHGEPTIGETTQQVLQILVLVAMMLVITFFGRLSDRVGRRPIVIAGCIAMIVLSFPAILLIRSGSAMPVFGGLLLMGLMLVCWNSTMPSTLPALFPTEVRYGGLSIAFNIAVSLFGGTVGAVVGGLVLLTGDLNFPAYYLMGAGVVGAVAIYFTKESAGKPLPGSAPAAADQQEAKEIAAASSRS